ncbi:MAG TPA: alcohol dehydrogenase catalytic domain-containing protein, partial [Thermomicrobiales bacterium]|nr:alcohol dehydrogenase catalytic domain-containing protein [Thermomicrobiales bacterium]
SDSMKAVLFPGDRQVAVVDRPRPEPGPGEVVIALRASAICRSDMSLYYGKPIVGGEATGSGQIVPGHEPAGEVVAVGPGVTSVTVGDRVAAYLAIGCGHCEWCQRGYYFLCPDWKCLGFDVNGGDADYMLLPAANCLPLPDGISYEVGAVMTDMIGTQYDAQRRLHVSGATTVAIFGLGPMGGAGVLVAKARGARVIALDILDSRLELAKSLGADEVINSKTEDPVARLRELTDGRGVEVAIDSSGSPAGQNAALDGAARFGHVAFIGESRATEINPSDQVIRKLLTVIGAWYFPIWEWTDITRFVLEHHIPVDKLITYRFSIDQAAEAFRMFDQRQTEKAVFVWK